MDPTCANCKKEFAPRPNAKSQRYCGQKDCQKARKQKWHQEKLKADADYRQNQADAQASWAKRHPDYWKKYRERNAAYTTRNRILQRERNQRRRLRAPAVVANGIIAKMDAYDSEKGLKNKPFGRYQLIPVYQDGVIAKMDAWIVEIREITGDSGVAAACR